MEQHIDSTSVSVPRELAPTAQSQSGETLFFVVMIFFGLHTAISVRPGGVMLVPYAASFLAALGILSQNFHRISEMVFHWFVVLTCFVLAIAFFNGMHDGKLFVHLRSSSQFVYSMLIGYAAFLGITVAGPARVERTFFWVSLFLVLGATLEVLGPLKLPSDWFRSEFNAWYGAYNSNARDILRYGAYRPKFFASEPSILALSMGFSLFMWLSAKRSFAFSDWIAAIFLTIWGFYLVRSPNVLFGPLAVILVELISARAHPVVRSLKKALFGLYVMGTALLPAASIFATLTLPNAPKYIRDLSYFERIEAPFLIALDSVRSFPFFGIGMGDDEQMSELTIKTFHDMNLLALHTIAEVAGFGHLISNVFWEYWISLGLLGGFIMAMFLSSFAKFLLVPLSGITILVIAGVTFWQGFGGINSPLTWFSVFIVMAASFNRAAQNEPQIVALE